MSTTILWSLPVAPPRAATDTRVPTSHDPGRPLVTDPLDLLLDEDGDLAIVDGDFVLARGLPAVAQEVRFALQLFRGEWFLNLDAGVPYFQDILGSRFEAITVGNAFRDEMLKVPDVVEILALTISFDTATRKLSVTWQVRTSFGDPDPDVITSEISG